MYSIHYIVAKTFLPNPDNKSTINHKNKDRTNNCVENLEWATPAEQNMHKNIKVKDFNYLIRSLFYFNKHKIYEL
jgi:hypothetical protein